MKKLLLICALFLSGCELKNKPEIVEVPKAISIKNMTMTITKYDSYRGYYKYDYYIDGYPSTFRVEGMDKCLDLFKVEVATPYTIPMYFIDNKLKPITDLCELTTRLHIQKLEGKDGL